MIKSIILKEIRLALRDKGTYFWYFALPILFIVIFASVFGSVEDAKLKIHYIDADQTTMSKQLVETLEGMEGLELHSYNVDELEAQIERIRDGKLSSFLLIPEGFEEAINTGEQGMLKLYRDVADNESYAPVRAVLQNIVSGYREGKLTMSLVQMGLNEDEVSQILEAPIAIDEVRENSTSINMVTQVVPGYTVMFVFFIMITMVNNFIKDRNSGMIARLRTTPMKPLTYLVGMWVPNIMIVLIQCIALLSFGYFVYDLHLGNLLSISAIVISLALCVTGIGLALSLFVRSENQGVAFVQIIALGGAILGGLWFPIDMMPDFIQKLAQFVPQYWAQQGFHDVMLRDAHVGDIWLNLFVLLLFGALGLLIASFRYKKFLQQAVE